MEYISIKEASKLWGIDTSNIGKLCRKGKIAGAKIVAKNWLIPKNAQKPIDGRTRNAKENQNSSDFRFPLYVNFTEESFVPPLSKEEETLRQAQVFFYNCDFFEAMPLFEYLTKNAENIYVKICAHFFTCVLSATYNIDISWEKYYYSMNLLLSSDFPHKKEMELFLSWLDVIIGQFGKISEKRNTNSAYEYHPSAWYMNAFLSIFEFQDNNGETIRKKSSEPFGTLCLIMERDGYYVEAQELHKILFLYHFGAHNEEATLFHLRKAINIGYEHNLLFAIADVLSYYAETVGRILCEYPDSFAKKIQDLSKIIYNNFSRFAEKNSNTNVYGLLSKSDYRYVFYAVEGYPNKQVATLCGVSLRTVAKKYNDIYNKLGIKGKQELVAQMSTAFGNE